MSELNRSQKLIQTVKNLITIKNETTAIISSLAKKSGKTEKEVEELWKKAKSIVQKQYPKVKEGTERFYQIVVGILKKMVLEASKSSM